MVVRPTRARGRAGGHAPLKLFAAIDPPSEVVAHLRDAVSPIDDRLRWVRAEQWHVTTAFYGDVDDGSADELRERLARAASRTPPIALRIAGAGAFSRIRAARVLWAGIDGDVEQLRRLANRCRAAGGRSGIEMKDERFRPHLTLARSRRAPVDVTTHVEALASYLGPTWTATTLRLVRSTLGPTTTHETDDEWALSG